MSNNPGKLGRVVVIGTSAGGVEALRTLVAGLEPGLPAALAVVMHLGRFSPAVLAPVLAQAGALAATTAVDGERLLPGHIYVAPPDQHLLITDSSLRLTHGARENRTRPAIDPLFRSAAVAYGPAVIGVILTGMLDDGVSGLQAVKQCGGVAIVQDPADAAYPGMPENALAAVNVDHQVPLIEIAPLINRLAHEPTAPGPAIPEDLLYEVEIAMGTREDLDQLTRHAHGTAFSCPECGGRLWQIPGGPTEHFRCEVGHSYNPDSLMEGNGEGVEAALWTAIRLLEERARMIERIARHARPPISLSAQDYGERAEEARAHAQELRDLFKKLAQPLKSRGNSRGKNRRS